jgi:hypothetical protein
LLVMVTQPVPQLAVPGPDRVAVAPLVGAWKVTTTPVVTGSPSLLSTCADNAMGKAALMVPVWGVPATACKALPPSLVR